MILVFSLEDENSFQAVSRLHGQLSSLRGEGRGGLALALVGTQGKEGLEYCLQGSPWGGPVGLPNIGEGLAVMEMATWIPVALWKEPGLQKRES